MFNNQNTNGGSDPILEKGDKEGDTHEDKEGNKHEHEDKEGDTHEDKEGDKHEDVAHSKNKYGRHYWKLYVVVASIIVIILLVFIIIGALISDGIIRVCNKSGKHILENGWPNPNYNCVNTCPPDKVVNNGVCKAPTDADACPPGQISNNGVCIVPNRF